MYIYIYIHIHIYIYVRVYKDEYIYNVLKLHTIFQFIVFDEINPKAVYTVQPRLSAIFILYQLKYFTMKAFNAE